MILDATAGNRTMYETKDSDKVIYVDMERKLTIKPTIICDHTKTPFADNTFSTIFFDPPHGWGKGHHFYKYPDAKSFHEKWAGYGKVPRYYGWDKYRSKSHMIQMLYRAQQEFWRILKDDGLLWLKWNEVKTQLRSISAVFNRWDWLMRIHVDPKVSTAGTKKTFWVCMCKKKEGKVQTELG